MEISVLSVLLALHHYVQASNKFASIMKFCWYGKISTHLLLQWRPCFETLRKGTSNHIWAILRFIWWIRIQCGWKMRNELFAVLISDTWTLIMNFLSVFWISRGDLWKAQPTSPVGNKSMLANSVEAASINSWCSIVMDIGPENKHVFGVSDWKAFFVRWNI